MKIYEYSVTGSSPGPGIIVVVAKSSSAARMYVKAAVAKMNVERMEREWNPVKLVSLRPVSTRPFDNVVYANDGEQ